MKATSYIKLYRYFDAVTDAEGILFNGQDFVNEYQGIHREWIKNSEENPLTQSWLQIAFVITLLHDKRHPDCDTWQIRGDTLVFRRHSFRQQRTINILPFV